LIHFYKRANVLARHFNTTSRFRLSIGLSLFMGVEFLPLSKLDRFSK